jgi:hypothetical protein
MGSRDHIASGAASIAQKWQKAGSLKRLAPLAVQR